MRRLTAAVLVAATAAAAPAAEDAQTIDGAMGKIAVDIAEFVLSEGFANVFVKEFDGPPGTSAGRLLRDKLRERLKAEGLDVVKSTLLAREGCLYIEGDFISDRRENSLAVLIKASVTDSTNESLSRFQHRVVFVDNVEEVSKLLGITADFSSADAEEVARDGGLDAAASGKDEKEKLENTRKAVVAKRFEEPEFFLVNNQVAASDGGDLRIEVIRTTGGRSESLPVDDARGLALVGLEVNDTYAVRLVNDSDQDVGVELLVDGLNSLMFSSNARFREEGKWVIAANSAGTVRGWHKGGGQSKEFLVVPTPDSELARLGKPTSDIGTITAVFYPAWSGDDVPEVERTLQQQLAMRAGTKQGADVADGVRTVQRKFGRSQLTTVSVRYVNPEPPEDAP